MADVAATLPLWSTTPGSNLPSDATTIGAGLADNLQAIQAIVREWLAHKGSDIVSAATTDLGAVPGLFHDITGSTGPITSFGTVSAGIWKIIKFEGTPTLTHNATSLILPGGANVVAAVGDMLQATSEGSGNWRVNWFTRASAQALLTPLPPMFMQGLILANNSGDATNDIDISAGQCRDATNAHNMIVAALTKQSDVAWAVGTAAGGLDTGAVGNSDYYVWAIKRSDTGVCDVLFSLSATAPTMPTNYDFKRLIGWFKRVGGTIVAFHAYEGGGGALEFLWDTPTADISLAATLTTARRTDAVKVPLNFSVIANLNVAITDAAAGSFAHIYCPDQADQAVVLLTATPLGNVYVAVAGQGGTTRMNVRTSSAGLIAARGTVATMDTYTVVTLGFIWSRRN